MSAAGSVVCEVAVSALAMSPRLAAADPVAVAREAGALSSAASALDADSRRLAGLGAEATGGSWAGAAADAFTRAAADHARRLQTLAALVVQLADALRRLAAALAQARQDAHDAVARSRRLDLEVDQLNQRIRGSAAAADPAAAGRLGVAAAELAGELSRVTTELQAAEWRADEAWQRAQGAFDGVTYATPVMRARMQGKGWDPSQHVSLAASGALACTVMDELGLPRDGVLTGPDGRQYPLIVQTARDREGQLVVTTREVPEKRGDWQQLAVRYGATEYGRRAAGWEKVAVALGGLAGAGYPDGATFAPQLLRQLQLMPGGGAYFPAGDDRGADGNVVKEAGAEPPRAGQARQYWRPPMSGVAAGRRAAVPDAIGLLDAGLSGVLLAGRLDDGRAAAYRVVFEEDSRGQRRARMQLFRVVSAEGESPSTLAAAGYVDSSGQLAGTPVTGEDPDRHPIMRPAGR